MSKGFLTPGETAQATISAGIKKQIFRHKTQFY